MCRMFVTPRPLGRSERGTVPSSEVRSQAAELLIVRWVGLNQAGKEGVTWMPKGRILQQRQGIRAEGSLGLCVLHPDSNCKFTV